MKGVYPMQNLYTISKKYEDIFTEMTIQFFSEFKIARLFFIRNMKTFVVEILYTKNCGFTIVMYNFIAS